MTVTPSYSCVCDKFRVWNVGLNTCVCDTSKYFVADAGGNCICDASKLFTKDATDSCICDISKNLVMDNPNQKCVCDPQTKKIWDGS